ncbi:AtaL-like protein [Algihabitans albus]|uniref:AtaL-like protein n=1 Tax=Algihabitans albus TaxID=2164067 RepID=UPI000E5CBBA9|nr:AtaL-like protein [Algihabitans albus]
MPYATHTEEVAASVATIWRLLVDKIENPGPYVPGVRSVDILKRAADHVVRHMVTEQLDLTERITRDARRLEVVFTLVDHPSYVGSVTNRIEPGRAGEANRLTFTIDWREFGGANSGGEHLQGVLRDAVRHTKALAEAEEPEL